MFRPIIDVNILLTEITLSQTAPHNSRSTNMLLNAKVALHLISTNIINLESH